jgi:ribosomal protein L29
MKDKEELKELKLKSISELQRLLYLNREKLRDIRFKISQSQVKNIREIRVIKTRIARINSLLNTNQDKEPVEKKIEKKPEEIKPVK